VDDLSLDTPKTKDFLKVANALGLFDALIVTDVSSENLSLGIRNLKAFKAVSVDAVNVYDILAHEQLVFTRPALEKITEVLAK
jgi:large subunit ribosomal protein L4